MYLVSQIAISLAVATTLGVAIGWWLRSLRPAARSEGNANATMLMQARSELVKLEAQMREMAPQSQLLAPRLGELDKRNEVLEATLKTLHRDAERDRDELESTAKQLEELQAVHADCDFAFAALRDQIVTLRAKVASLQADEAALPEHRKAS